jgi:hypothetical protein
MQWLSKVLKVHPVISLMNIFKPVYAGIDMIYMPHIHSKSLLLLSWATEITKEGRYSFLLLCLKVSFLLFFSPSIRPRIWFVCF